MACLVGDGLQFLNELCCLLGRFILQLDQYSNTTRETKRNSEERMFTLQILGREDNGAKMMLLDEATDLWCDCSAVPSHQ